MKKILLATAAYFVISMLVAYPWHVIFFKDQYEAWGAFTRAQPIMALGMSAILIQGLVFSWLYPKCYGGGNPIWEGVRFNLIVGLLVYTAMGFATAAKIQIEPISSFLIFHTIFQIIQFSLTGAAIGLIYGRIGQTSQHVD